jgi:glycosyltransferase involved in cell wall biosynthesis
MYMTTILRKPLLLFRKVLNFYGRNGIKLTLQAIRFRTVSRWQKDYTFSHLVKKFPQRFGTLPRQHSGQVEELVNSAGQAVINTLLPQLSITGDMEGLLPLLKSRMMQDEYFHFLDTLFTLDKLLTEDIGIKTYPLVQTSNLPENSQKELRRRILFITSQFPNPQNGGGNRVLNFIKVLSETHDIYLSTCFVPEDDEVALKIITPYCQAIQKIPLAQFGGNQAEIRKWLNGLKMDIVHYEWPRSLLNYDAGLGRYHIFTYMEAASLRLLMDMQQLEPLSDTWLTKLVELAHTLRLELVDTFKLSARIAVTTKDGDFFRGLYPYQEYAVLNHGITFKDFCLADVAPEPNTLVFVGNYQHHPNVAAMEFFFQEIWPDILREVPETRLYLVGPKPPQEIKFYADNQRVIITGGVDDIRPYIQKASVCIAPLITGAGMRGKVIDYAALRRPFVATSIATTDLAFRDEIEYMRADTAEEFSRKVIVLLKDQTLARQMAAAAYDMAQKYYDNRQLTDYLKRLYKHLEDTENA